MDDDKFSKCVFSYWGLIHDIVEEANVDPKKKQLLAVAEQDLETMSHSGSQGCFPLCFSSFSRLTLPNGSLLPGLACPLRPGRHPPKHIYPSLSFPSPDEPLDPGDAQELEDEVARYRNSNWEALALAPSLAPPYRPPSPPLFCALAVVTPKVPHDVPDPKLALTKQQLSAKVQGHRRILDLKKTIYSALL